MESFGRSTLCPVSHVLMNKKVSTPKLIIHFQLKGFAVCLWKWLKSQMGEKYTTKLIMPHLQALSFHLLNRCLINNSRLYFLADEFAFHEIIKLKKKPAKLAASRPLSLAWPRSLSWLTPSLLNFLPDTRKQSQREQWAYTATQVLWGICLLGSVPMTIFIVLSLSLCHFYRLFARCWWMRESTFPSCFCSDHGHFPNRHNESQSASMASCLLLHLHYPPFSFFPFPEEEEGKCILALILNLSSVLAHSSPCLKIS